MGYKDELRRVVDRIEKEHPEHIPEKFPREILSNPRVSDEDAYRVAKAWRDETSANYNNSQRPSASNSREELHFQLKRYGNNLQVINTRTHGIDVSITKNPDGTISYFGDKKYIELLGGTGGLSKIAEMFDDKSQKK